MSSETVALDVELRKYIPTHTVRTYIRTTTWQKFKLELKYKKTKKSYKNTIVLSDTDLRKYIPTHAVQPLAKIQIGIKI